MNKHCLKTSLILTILCALAYKAHSHTLEISIDTEECQIALLSHKETLSNFFEAIQQDDTDQLLILRDTDNSYQDGQILLHYASFLGKIETIHTLVSKMGFDINVKNQNGWTALHHAMQNEDIGSRIDAIYALIELGADVHTLDNSGYKPSNYVIDENKNYSEYSPKQKEKLVKMAIKTNASEIGKLFQVNPSTLSAWVSLYKKENGLTTRKLAYYTPEQRKEAVELALKKNALEASKITGVPESTVRNWASFYKKENKLTMRKISHYTPEQKREAVELALKTNVSKASEITKIPNPTIRDWISLREKGNKLVTKYTPEQRKDAVNLALRVGTLKAAEIIGVHRDTLSKWIRKDGKGRPKYSQKEKNEIVKLARKNSIKTTAKQFDISIRTLSGWVSIDSRNKGMSSLKYSKEYKKKLIELSLQFGIAKVLRDFDIPERTLSEWIHTEKEKRGLPSKWFLSSEYKDKKYKAIELAFRFTTKVASQETFILMNTISSSISRLYKETRALESQRLLSYTPEQKDEAIRLAARGDQIGLVAKKLNIPLEILVLEIRKYEKEKKKQYLNYILKLEALKAVIEDGDGIQEVAKDFGITEKLLTVWVEEYQDRQVKENENTVNSTLSVTVSIANAVELDIREQKTQKPVIKLYEEWDDLFLYPKELKQQAVQALKNDFDTKKVAEEFGISREVLMLFFREYIYNM